MLFRSDGSALRACSFIARCRVLLRLLCLLLLVLTPAFGVFRCRRRGGHLDCPISDPVEKLPDEDLAFLRVMGIPFVVEAPFFWLLGV